MGFAVGSIPGIISPGPEAAKNMEMVEVIIRGRGCGFDFEKRFTAVFSIMDTARF